MPIDQVIESPIYDNNAQSDKIYNKIVSSFFHNLLFK